MRYFHNVGRGCNSYTFNQMRDQAHKAVEFEKQLKHDHEKTIELFKKCFPSPACRNSVFQVSLNDYKNLADHLNKITRLHFIDV